MTKRDKIRDFLKINDALDPARNHHIDALKGFAIIAVVFLHAIQVNDPHHDSNRAYLALISWAMPLFMLLSGFILSTQFGYSVPRYLKKNFLRLLVPFFVWALVNYVLYNSSQSVNLFPYLWSIVKSPGKGLWFLWVLFFNSAFLFTVIKVVRIKNWVRWENYFVIAAIVVARTASADIFGLSECRLYFPYYAAGFFAYKYYDFLIAKRKIIYAMVLVVFPLLLVGWRRNAFPTFYPVLLQIFGETGIARFIVSIYKYMVAFSGMFFSSFLVELARKIRLYNFFCWMGILSMDIYVCHGNFIYLRGLGEGGIRYFSVGVAAIMGSLALTLFLLKRFRITRMLFLGEKH